MVRKVSKDGAKLRFSNRFRCEEFFANVAGLKSNFLKKKQFNHKWHGFSQK
jgi:hypothetical protein